MIYHLRSKYPNGPVRIRGYEARWPWPKQPHTCPVCNGTGQVPRGFYNTTGEPVSHDSAEHCRSSRSQYELCGNRERQIRLSCMNREM